MPMQAVLDACFVHEKLKHPVFSLAQAFHSASANAELSKNGPLL